MSFPSLLLALIVLYTLGPSIPNLIIVLAITRIPIYLRTTRAEVLELRERMFVSAAKAMGAGSLRIVLRHIAPLVAPTLITIAAIDFASVILAESALSFLGLGIQPPQFTWGAMVATGRGYLANAWWVAFWPGLRDPADHAFPEPLVELGQDGRRSAAAVAAPDPAEGSAMTASRRCPSLRYVADGRFPVRPRPVPRRQRRRISTSPMRKPSASWAKAARARASAPAPSWG